MNDCFKKGRGPLAFYQFCERFGVAFGAHLLTGDELDENSQITGQKSSWYYRRKPWESRSEKRSGQWFCKSISCFSSQELCSMPPVKQDTRADVFFFCRGIHIKFLTSAGLGGRRLGETGRRKIWSIRFIHAFAVCGSWRYGGIANWVARKNILIICRNLSWTSWDCGEL